MPDACDGLTLPDRTLRAVAATDDMPPELRACVHEYGFAIVQGMRQAGVTDPRRIRQLVHTVWMGARQPNQRVGGTVGRKHSPVLEHLDWLLLQAGAAIPARTLLRTLFQHNMVIVSREPADHMVAASMDATNHMGVVSKAEKHRRRLRAAITAGARRLWPHLFEERADA